MPTYVLPQVLVFQDFTTVPTAVANPLRAHISGPHAKLIRYAETDERDQGLLGYYDRLIDSDYAFPNRPAGGKVDPAYVKVWMKDALLQYFADHISADSTITKTSGYNNRIRSATINFAENTSTYPRAAALLDRDVQPGDTVKVRGLNSLSEPVTLWTYVKRLIGDTVPSVVDAASADADNPANQSASSSYEQISGPENCITLAIDHSGYNGLVTGNINETYDIIVLESSVNGDFTTAELRVISGSGDDDQVSVTPSAEGETTEIGTSGLLVTFNVTSSAGCSASAVNDDVSPVDLVAGQRFRVTVADAFTKPVATSSGTYDDTHDTTYIATVTRGGLYADVDAPPQITVTTTNGVDISGPTDVTAAATPVDVGSHGVQIEFSGAGLRKGDKYYIEVTGEFEGPMRTIELANNLDTDISAGSEVDLELFIRKPLLQIAEDRIGFAPQVNWELNDDETQITINSGVIAYDESWTDGGVQEPLDVYSEESKGFGKLYLEVRYWLSDLCNEVGSITDVGEIDTLISGVLHPDNPLKWGVFKALENANGVAVKYTSVCDPANAESWADVLGLLLGRDDVYGLVPLTRDRTVLDLYAAHVDSMSSPENALWRTLWVNLEGLPTIPVVSAGSSVPGHLTATTTDGEVALAVVEDDPQSSGTQYTVLRCTTANGDFITNGVRAGDVVRLLYTEDGFGHEEYTEAIVDDVVSEDELRFLTGLDAPINVAAKFEIWRNLSATEEAAAIAVNAGSWGDRRVRATWPDTIESSGTLQEGYFLNCALAGLASGILPHQGMTNLEITGFSDVSRTTGKFNRPQLDSMALGGVWIVTQELSPTAANVGRVYTRHALTTGEYDNLNEREEMITRNVDSISYLFKDHFRPFIGVTNVTPVIQARLQLETEKVIRTLQTETSTNDLGPQLITATIVELRPHTTLLDRYVLKLDCDVPEPFNNFEIHLMI